MAEEGAKRNFDDGDTVKVCYGPLMNFKGVVQWIDAFGKVVVALDIFGRNTVVGLDKSVLEKV
jgi:transcription antitermination factor NusG